MAEPSPDDVRALVNQFRDDRLTLASLAKDRIAMAALMSMREQGTNSASVPFHRQQTAADEYEYYSLKGSADRAGQQAAGRLTVALCRYVYSVTTETSRGDVYDFYINITLA